MYRTTNWRALALAFIAFLGVTTAAFALSSTSSQNFSARLNTTQQTNYYRFTINYNDANISTGVKFGRLPANAFVSNIKCQVTTPFNGGSTNVVIVGTTASAGDIIASGDLNEAAIGLQALTTAAGLGLAVTTPGEQDLYARYTLTGTAATAGSVTCVLEYVPNNDQ